MDGRAQVTALALGAAPSLAKQARICLVNGGATWNPGETLGVDIQARSNYGDNAAQKVYFRGA